MMDCRRFRRLIMTDYIDDEASPSVRKELEQHISVCSRCRIFEQTLRESVVAPFQDVSRPKAPETTWQNIKISLERGQQRSIGPSVIDDLRRIFQDLHPVYAAAAYAVLLLAIFIVRLTFDDRRETNAYIGEQIEFLSSLQTDGEADKEYADFDTAIERYLL